MIRKFFKWIFKKELLKLETKILELDIKLADNKMAEKRFNAIFDNLGVSADISSHKYDPSWAVISLQGQRADFVKFVNLGERDIREIQRFLRNFENRNVDCAPHLKGMFKIDKRRF